MNVACAGWGDQLGKSTQPVLGRFDRDPDCGYHGIIEYPQLGGIYRGMGVAPSPCMVPWEKGVPPCFPGALSSPLAWRAPSDTGHMLVLVP